MTVYDVSITKMTGQYPLSLILTYFHPTYHIWSKPCALAALMRCKGLRGKCIGHYPLLSPSFCPQRKSPMVMKISHAAKFVHSVTNYPTQTIA